MNALPLSWWIVAALSGAGFGVLWWQVRGRHRLSRRRALQAHLEACGRVESADEAAALDRLREAAQAARRDDREGRRPWFLFLGGAASQTTRLLAKTPATGTSASAPPHWSWTPMPSMTAIAMAPAFADGADTPSTRRAWCHALRALTEARRHVPLNGIAVCFAARDLQHVPGLREAAGRLRRRIDEAALHLRLQFPVFLLVTGLEGLPGYAVVRDALPDAVVREAVGHRLPLDAHRGTGETGEVFATPMAQWQALRMTLLRAHPAASERLAIHTFVEGLRDMEAGLAIVTDVLFAPDENGAPAQPWRGLYLTAADARGGVFVHDLFERFLPADRPLAHAITSPRRSGSGARRSSR